MKQLVIWLLLIVVLELLFAWIMTHREASTAAPQFLTRQSGMARGLRQVSIDPESVAFASPGRMAIRYRFECFDTTTGDRIFAFVLVQCDSTLRVPRERLFASSSAIQLHQTHIFDSYPVARGWTLSGFAPGDTSILECVLEWARTPARDFADTVPESGIRFLCGMDHEDDEPESAGVLIERRLLVK